MIPTTFEPLKADDGIQDIIKAAFDITLDIQGAWGYSQEEAIIINSSEVPLTQLEHTLASMRTHIEMSMTQPKEKRYGAISLSEKHRKNMQTDKRKYAIITFEISAMLEETYAKFINEYKAGQDSVDFDIQDHFHRRKKSTLKREEVFWFDVTHCI